jgi:hypothetical protein
MQQTVGTVPLKPSPSLTSFKWEIVRTYRAEENLITLLQLAKDVLDNK